MKEKIFINARIIDPSQNMDEKGSLILNDNGKVRAIGKSVKKKDVSPDAERRERLLPNGPPFGGVPTGISNAHGGWL